MASLQSDLHNTTLPYLHLVDVLKHLPRTGWLRFVDHPESVAAHMYRMALIAMICAAEKYKLEEFGFKYIRSLLKKVNPELGQELMDLWIEFEEGDTPEAKWMQEVDKFECMIQAHDYEQQTYGEKDLDEFQGSWNASKVVSVQGRADLKLLSLEREAHFANRKQELPLIFIIGAPGAGKKSQADLLARDGGFKTIDVEEVILEKSRDQTYLHAEFLADCIENSVRAPTTLLVGLLEEKIKESVNGGNNWVIAVGFPDSMQQLVGFQRQVQKNTYTLLLKSAAKPEGTSDKKQAAAYRDMKELEKHLSTTDCYFKMIDIDGSAEAAHNKVKEAVVCFTKHKENEK